MNTNIDTIAALCTAPGKAAISIVRVSGPGAFAVADMHIILHISSRQPVVLMPVVFSHP